MLSCSYSFKFMVVTYEIYYLFGILGDQSINLAIVKGM